MSLSEDALVRVLERGGMAVEIKDGFRVFRTQDARRGEVGVLSADRFARLLGGDALVELADKAQRWIWRSEDEGVETRPSLSALDVPSAQRRRTKRTVLEAALEQVKDEHERSWLARAAMRFLRDCERRSAVQSVTMNWDFDLSGHRRGRRGQQPGMSEISLAAARVLSAIQDNLDEADFRSLEQALVARVSRRVLATEFALDVASISVRVAGALKQLARLYDGSIAAEV